MKTGTLFIEVSGRCGPQKLSVQCGSHKRIQCWSNPDYKIRTIHHPTEKGKFRLYTPHYCIFPNYIIRKPWCFLDYIIRTTPDHYGRWSTSQRKRFANILDGGQVKKHVFNYGFPPFFYPPSPINMLHFLKKFHTFFLLFENPLGVIWSVNREGVSLGVSLTIMVSHWYSLPPPPK